MSLRSSPTRITAIVAAAGLVLLLAVSLAARVSARSGPGARGTLPSLAPAPASVPEPRTIVPAELPTPFCWGCGWNRQAPLEFQLDLDLLAPLGDGPSNAALWFARFARDGADPVAGRFDGYRQRRVEVTIDGRAWNVLPGDDALLLEAEPWVDQATMSFYPEVWEVRGLDTSLPNLLLMLDLARSWVARGKLVGDGDRAREDFRRAIRLGRLLRQDDVTIVQDLIAIACVRIGAEAIYELARAEGDAATMTAATLVLADKDAMRQRTAQRITTLEHTMRVVDPEAKRLSLGLSDAELESAIELIREAPERRFRAEGLVGMHVVSHLGTPRQQGRALAVLEEFSGSGDELTAQLARNLRESDLDAESLRGMFDRH